MKTTEPSAVSTDKVLTPYHQWPTSFWLALLLITSTLLVMHICQVLSGRHWILMWDISQALGGEQDLSHMETQKSIGAYFPCSMTLEHEDVPQTKGDPLREWHRGPGTGAEVLSSCCTGCGVPTSLFLWLTRAEVLTPIVLWYWHRCTTSFFSLMLDLWFIVLLINFLSV